MARHIICVNDIQKAAIVGRGIPEGKIIVAMNVPDPKVFDHNRTIQRRANEDGRFRMIYHGTVTKTGGRRPGHSGRLEAERQGSGTGIPHRGGGGRPEGVQGNSAKTWV